MNSLRQQLVEAAWPTLQPWIDDRTKATGAASGVGDIVTVRSSDAFMEEALRNRTSTFDGALTDALEVHAASRFTGDLACVRLRTELVVGEEHTEPDVLRQMAWGSERQRARVHAWVDRSVRAESGFLLHTLGHAPRTEPPLVLGHRTMERIELKIGHREFCTSFETIEIDALPIDATSLQACRRALGDDERPLWIAVSDASPTPDAAATATMRGGRVSRVPASVLPHGIVLVMALDVLDAVLVRPTETTVGWDVGRGRAVLVIEQLLAVEVLRPPPAIVFRRSS